MNSEILARCIGSIPDRMVEEAINSRRKGMGLKCSVAAAIVCICVAIGAGVLSGRPDDFPAQCDPWMVQPEVIRNEEVLKSSEFGTYYPDLSSAGFKFRRAELYEENMAAISLVSDDGLELKLRIQRKTEAVSVSYSEEYRKAHLVDMDSGDPEPIERPFFYAEQLSEECFDYIIPVETTENPSWQFSIIGELHYVTYSIYCERADAEEIFRCICK